MVQQNSRVWRLARCHSIRSMVQRGGVAAEMTARTMSCGVVRGGKWCCWRRRALTVQALAVALAIGDLFVADLDRAGSLRPMVPAHRRWR